jgi:hypothetical protein
MSVFFGDSSCAHLERKVCSPGQHQAYQIISYQACMLGQHQEVNLDSHLAAPGKGGEFVSIKGAGKQGFMGATFGGEWRSKAALAHCTVHLAAIPLCLGSTTKAWLREASYAVQSRGSMASQRSWCACGHQGSSAPPSTAALQRCPRLDVDDLNSCRLTHLAGPCKHAGEYLCHNTLPKRADNNNQDPLGILARQSGSLATCMSKFKPLKDATGSPRN